MDNNKLGNKIREARGDLSLRDFAKKCGISHTHLDSIEKGYDPRTGKPVKVSLDTIKKLSAGTGIPLHNLIDYDLNELIEISEKPAWQNSLQSARFFPNRYRSICPRLYARSTFRSWYISYGSIAKRKKL